MIGASMNVSNAFLPFMDFLSYPDMSISNVPGIIKVATYLIKSEESFDFETIVPFLVPNDFSDLCVMYIDSVIEI